MAALLAWREIDFCPLTNQLGQVAAPLLDAAHEVLTTDPINEILDKAATRSRSRMTGIASCLIRRGAEATESKARSIQRRMPWR